MISKFQQKIFNKFRRWKNRNFAMFSWNLQVFRSMLINNLSEFHELLQKMQWFPEICIICENKPLSGPRRRAPRPERGAWRRLCTAWVHSRKPCKRRTANRNEQKFTEQKRTCAIWNDSVGLIQHFSSRWPCRPLFRKCNNTSEHEFRERVVRRYPLKRETSPREIMSVNAGSDALTSELKLS